MKLFCRSTTLTSLALVAAASLLSACDSGAKADEGAGPPANADAITSQAARDAAAAMHNQMNTNLTTASDASSCGNAGGCGGDMPKMAPAHGSGMPAASSADTPAHAGQMPGMDKMGNMSGGMQGGGAMSNGSMAQKEGCCGMGAMGKDAKPMVMPPVPPKTAHKPMEDEM